MRPNNPFSVLNFGSTHFMYFSSYNQLKNHVLCRHLNPEPLVWQIHYLNKKVPINPTKRFYYSLCFTIALYTSCNDENILKNIVWLIKTVIWSLRSFWSAYPRRVGLSVAFYFWLSTYLTKIKQNKFDRFEQSFNACWEF